MQSFEASQLVIIILNEKFNIIHGFSDVNNRKWCILFSLDLLKQVWKLVLLRLVVNVCSIFPNLQHHYVMDIWIFVRCNLGAYSVVLNKRGGHI